MSEVPVFNMGITKKEQIESLIDAGADIDGLYAHFGRTVMDSFLSNPDNVELIDPSPARTTSEGGENAA